MVLIFICITCVDRYKYEYYPNGNIEIQAEIKNGVDDGTLLEYFENGSLKSEHTANWMVNLLIIIRVGYFLEKEYIKKTRDKGNGFIITRIVLFFRFNIMMN